MYTYYSHTCTCTPALTRPTLACFPNTAMHVTLSFAFFVEFTNISTDLGLPLLVVWHHTPMERTWACHSWWSGATVIPVERTWAYHSWWSGATTQWNGPGPATPGGLAPHPNGTDLGLPLPVVWRHTPIERTWACHSWWSGATVIPVERTWAYHSRWSGATAIPMKRTWAYHSQWSGAISQWNGPGPATPGGLAPHPNGTDLGLPLLVVWCHIPAITSYQSVLARFSLFCTCSIHTSLFIITIPCYIHYQLNTQLRTMLRSLRLAPQCPAFS